MSRTLSPAVRAALDAAVDELAYADGWHAVTLDEICARAGVSKPAVYRHVGTRDELLLDYLDRRRARRMATLRAAMEAAGDDPRDRLEALLFFYVTWIGDPAFAGCGFHRALQQRSPSQPAVRARTVAYKAELHDLLATEVARIGRPASVADHLFLLVEGALAAGAYDDPSIVTGRLAAAFHDALDAPGAPGGVIRR
ncbi:MAG: TetR/AcrR family transcriptional regulator [Chloroflexota bacterium]